MTAESLTCIRCGRVGTRAFVRTKDGQDWKCAVSWACKERMKSAYRDGAEMKDSVTNIHGHKIRQGQIWADNDPRCEGRTIRIDSADARYAYCEVLTAVGGGIPKMRRVRMLIDRLHPTKTGYRLIEDPEGEQK